jgi:hypothetical protein
MWTNLRGNLNLMEIIKSLGKQYKADITAGALKVPESRHIAGLLLRRVDAEGWKDAIAKQNVLQARSPATARRLTRLIRGRLETMGPDLWKLVRDGKGSVATHAVFAAAVKHSPLLGDFLRIVVGEQYRLFGAALSNKLFDDYLEGCRARVAGRTPFSRRFPSSRQAPRSQRQGRNFRNSPS